MFISHVGRGGDGEHRPECGQQVLGRHRRGHDRYVPDGSHREHQDSLPGEGVRVGGPFVACAAWHFNACSPPEHLVGDDVRQHMEERRNSRLLQVRTCYCLMGLVFDCAELEAGAVLRHCAAKPAICVFALASSSTWRACSRGEPSSRSLALLTINRTHAGLSQRKKLNQPGSRWPRARSLVLLRPTLRHPWI